MKTAWHRVKRIVLVGSLLASLLSGTSVALAVEIGQEAPDFNLTATSGGKISLSQFRGKQPVLIEFYSADFAPA